MPLDARMPMRGQRPSPVACVHLDVQGTHVPFLAEPVSLTAGLPARRLPSASGRPWESLAGPCAARISSIARDRTAIASIGLDESISVSNLAVNRDHAKIVGASRLTERYSGNNDQEIVA